MARTVKVAKRNPRAKGLVRAVARLEPHQLAALTAEAQRRARERGSRQIDVSEIVREGIELWLSRRR